jgi:hypothetical protein
MADTLSYMPTPEALYRASRANPLLLVSDDNWIQARRHLWTPELFNLNADEIAFLNDLIVEDMQQKHASVIIGVLKRQGFKVIPSHFTKSGRIYDFEEVSTFAEDMAIPLDEEDIQNALHKAQITLSCYRLLLDTPALSPTLSISLSGLFDSM